MPKKISSATRYAFAIGSVLVATMVRILLTPMFGNEFAFLPFYIAVIFTTWFAGFAPGIFSILLGFISANALVYIHTALDADPLSITAYLSLTLTIAFFGKSMHESRWLANLRGAEALQRQRDLQARSAELKDEADRRAKAEAALFLAEERLRALFEAPISGIAEVECGSGRFWRVSQGFCQLFGYTSEELLQMDLRQISAESEGPRALWSLVRGETLECPAETRAVSKSGRSLWVAVSAVPVHDPQGHIGTTLLLAQDVSAIHQAQETEQSAQQQLRNYASDVERGVAERTTELTQTVSSLENFCFSVSHQLLGPIHRVNTNARVLFEKLELSPPAKEHAQRIFNSAGQLNQMVQSLLDYGRLAREPMPLDTLFLQPIIEHVMVQLASEIKAAQAQITVQAAGQVRGHPLLLQRVFLNLLRNAITYARVDVPPQVIIRTEELPAAMRIWVIDNGIGIDPCDYEKIFHILVRLNQSGEYAGGGTGLAIVKKAMDRMSGRVGVQSTPGAGSSFWIELPKP